VPSPAGPRIVSPAPVARAAGPAAAIYPPAAAEPTPQVRTNSYEPPQSWYDDCDLDAGAARLLWYGLSKNSRRTYETARSNYVLFCAHRGLTPFPATATILCSWVHSLSERRLQHKTIKLYITGLKSRHIDLGISTEGFRDDRLDRVVRGCKRENPPAPGPRTQRMPITRPILLQLLANLDPTRPEDVTLRAAFCLAHAAFLRIGEFTWSPKDLANGQEEFAKWKLTRQCIQILPNRNRMLLTIPTSKGDWGREGVTLTLSGAADAACPINAIREMDRICPRWTPLSPLFERPPNDRDEQVAFTKEYVVNQLRALCWNMDLPGYFSGHSFRRGSATSAHNAGLSEAEIKVLGRWKSDSVKRYIDHHPGYLETLAERFQNAPEIFNPPARYPLHWHHNDPQEDDPQLPPGYDEL
jgi:integrase